MTHVRLKKINALLSLAALLFLLIHIGYELFSYITFFYNPVVTNIIAYAFMGCAALHGVLAVFILVQRHDGSTLGTYPAANLRTILQRASAALIVVLLPIHVKTGDWIANHAGGEWLLWLLVILQLFFWAAALTHIGTSLTRALISLGWLQNRKTQKVLDVIVWILCACAFAASCVVIIKTQFFLFHMH